MKKCLYLLAILALLLQPTLTFLPAASAQEGAAEPQAPTDVTLYVKPLATGTGDCSSWANACGLQTALGAAVSGDEIWVQAGVHKPTPGSDRTATFFLRMAWIFMAVSPGQRPAASSVIGLRMLTILSGDIGAAGNGDNSYHVVTGSGVASTAILDGFTITAGNATVLLLIIVAAGCTTMAAALPRQSDLRGKPRLSAAAGCTTLTAAPRWTT